MELIVLFDDAFVIEPRWYMDRFLLFLGEMRKMLEGIDEHLSMQDHYNEHRS